MKNYSDRYKVKFECISDGLSICKNTKIKVKNFTGSSIIVENIYDSYIKMIGYWLNSSKEFKNGFCIVTIVIF